MIEISRKTISGKVIHICVLGVNELDFVSHTKDPVVEYRQVVSKRTGKKQENIFLLNQVHGDQVIDADALPGVITEADGLFSSSAEKILVVKTADCMPVFIWSNERPFFAVIHSGWKGLVNGIVEKFLENNIHKKESISMFVGPCISQAEYEIGLDVAHYFIDSKALQSVGTDKYIFGQLEYLREKLQRNWANIQIEDSGICVRQSPDYFSYRKGDRGRNLNCIWMSTH